MDMMTMDDMQAVAMVLRERSTYIPIELEHDVAIVDLTAIDLDKLGRGLSSSSACVQRLLQAYRPDFKAVEWWLNGSQTTRKLKCKTTDRIKAFDRQMNIISVNDKPYTLSAKGRGRYYLGFGIRVFGQNHTAYIHNLIGAEVFARVHKSEWTSWAKSAWNEDHLVFNGYKIHHLLPYETATVAGNTPMNLILLDDWTHETTKVQYNQLRRRMIDHDVDMSKTLILPKNGAMQAIQNIPNIG
ncbi:hypothetical protein PO250_04270 [Limosilactobacillus mucosae]|uniref:Uncharacterized protein n=1 Tax=Limosilactobacillus mucosae TaxID=97478 RepID=A0AAJ1HTQ6_LIMMU|nr:hypothetical protein [Limosilactobacillus mucosae]MDC2829535.1 hypothetical protein [Limosilactobacillus mucosae]